MSRFAAPHAWEVTPREARRLQEELRPQVSLVDALPSPVTTVAGIDVGFEDEGRTTRAAVVVLKLADLSVVERVVARRPTAFPYVPGLLSFREIPAVLDALEQLAALPDLVLCDGQGYAHPRRLGIACHLGLVTGLPTIGCAKSRLLGEHGELAPLKGAWTELTDAGETIGAVIRSRDRVRPLYISAGHRVSLTTAIAYTFRCLRGYRLPETTRLAHRLASHGQ